ncbi:hypothetical protein L1887_30151 [Cichorium endivia]|nr:hypothetical protein L1887_30151 [Cichorium endivia]
MDSRPPYVPTEGVPPPVVRYFTATFGRRNPPIDCSSIDDGSPSLDSPISKPVENDPITPTLVLVSPTSVLEGGLVSSSSYAPVSSVLSESFLAEPIKSIELSRSSSTTQVTIPPVLSTLSPSAMFVVKPSSPIGEFSILGHRLGCYVC